MHGLFIRGHFAVGANFLKRQEQVNQKLVPLLRNILRDASTEPIGLRPVSLARVSKIFQMVVNQFRGWSMKNYGFFCGLVCFVCVCVSPVYLFIYFILFFTFVGGGMQRGGHRVGECDC